MKKSLKNTVLILSLAGLVIAGSGCERRGRAVKKDAPKDGIVSTETGNDPTTVTGNTEKPADPSMKTEPVEISNEETQLLADAKVDCPLFPSKAGALRSFIDATETPTAETMATDVDAMNRLRVCLGGDEKNSVQGYGVKALNGTWAIDGGVMNEKGEEIGDDGAVRNPHSSLLTAFDTEATASGSDDEKAAKTLKSRLAVFSLNANKMIDKYSSLPTDTEFGAESTNRPTVGKTLENFTALISGCEKAKEKVDGYWTVRGGIDRLTTEAVTPVSE